MFYKFGNTRCGNETAIVEHHDAAGTVRRFVRRAREPFGERVRHEAERRLGRACRLELGVQTEFHESPVRINTDLCDTAVLGWSEAQAWDEFAAYYVP